ncbi:hypothetical protein FIU90_00710 [Erythrobacter sp. THAF29]|nr:hypothetical protein FIU90_00710 [Erythrobacter sp. THAF29]
MNERRIESGTRFGSAVFLVVGGSLAVVRCDRLLGRMRSMHFVHPPPCLLSRYQIEPMRRCFGETSAKHCDGGIGRDASSNALKPGRKRL